MRACPARERLAEGEDSGRQAMPGDTVADAAYLETDGAASQFDRARLLFLVRLPDVVDGPGRREMGERRLEP
jgi:hypothetical protein